MENSPVQPWRPFERVPNALAIANSLDTIPAQCALTPLRDKRPYRKNPAWNQEPPVDRELIRRGILEGHLGTSQKTGRPYRMYDSGFGLRTGDISGGILAIAKRRRSRIDVDGEEAEALLQAISGGDIPPTWEWTSGKPGRRQLAFQIPDDLRSLLISFQRHVVREWNGIHRSQDLDFRYNGHQSVLPPSRHPDTGQYRWRQSPSQTELAHAPQWLRELLLSFVSSPQQSNTGVRQHSQSNRPARAAAHAHHVDSDLSRRIQDEILSRLGAEQIYNWSGHNWQQRGEKMLGFCPQHGGQSGTAFQVNLSTLEWYCHGCNCGGHAVQYRWFCQGGQGSSTGQDFIDIVQELAADAGVTFSFPAYSERGEPDAQAYAEYLTWEQQQEQLEHYLHDCDCQQWIVNLFTKLQQKAAKLGRRLRQWGRSTTEFPPIQLNNFQYRPGELPPPEIYQSLGCPKIIFSEGDRVTLVRELQQLGWKYSLDTSHTGQGKTEDVVSWEVRYFDAHRFWLFTENPRLPQTATQETNYRPMPVRHNGMVRDSNLLTPLGNPVIRWPRQGESTNVTPNCYRAELFHTVAEIGYAIDGDQGDLRNPICRTCRFQGVCPKQQGTGFRFRRARKGIFGGFNAEGMELPGVKRVSLNPLSSPNPDNYDYSRDIGFWDESSRILRVTKPLTARRSDIDRVFGELEEKKPQLHQLLTGFRLALRRSLSDEKQPYYGWDHAALREKLPIPGNLAHILTQLQELQPDWDELFAEDSVGMDGVDMTGKKVAEYKRTKRKLAGVRRLLRRQPFEAAAELPVNWLIPTLQILAGLSSGSLRIHRGTLTITLRDTRMADVAKAMRFNLFLDATGHKNDLALALGVSTHEIVQIEQEPPDFSNLTIVQVNGFLRASNNRSDSCDTRIAIAKAKLREQHLDIAIFDHLSKKDTAGGCDAHHFGNQTRGSNVFALYRAIASFGIPAPSMSALQDYSPCNYWAMRCHRLSRI